VGAEEEYPFPCEKASQLEREGALPSWLYCEEETTVQMIKSDGLLEGFIRWRQSQRPDTEPTARTKTCLRTLRKSS